MRKPNIFLYSPEFPPAFTFYSPYSSYSDFYDNTEYFVETCFDDLEKSGLSSAIDYFLSDDSTNIFINAGYFVPSSDLKLLVRRFLGSFVNLSIEHEQATVIYIKNERSYSTHSFQLEDFPNIAVIDRQFLLNRFKWVRSRAKNDVLASDEVFIKSSHDKVKIRQEFDLLRNRIIFNGSLIPVSNYFESSDTAGYSMPKISPGDVSGYFLEENDVFFKEASFLDFISSYFSSLEKFESNESISFTDKLLGRLEERSGSTIAYFAQNDELKFTHQALFVQEYKTVVNTLKEMFSCGAFEFINRSPVGQIHGDLCLSNILYCSASSSFFLIDPRGDILTPHVYDFAKISHSILGGYDFILSGNFSLLLQEEGIKLHMPSPPLGLKNDFLDFIQSSSIISINEVRLLEAFLFATMIPFHFENGLRCLAFVIRAKDILTGLRDGKS